VTNSSDAIGQFLQLNGGARIFRLPAHSQSPEFGLGHLQSKQLSYRKEIAMQGGLVLAKSGRLGLEDNILQTL